MLARLGIAGHFLHVGMVTYGIHWSTAFSSSLDPRLRPIFTLLILRWMGVERLQRAQIVVSPSPSAACWCFSDKLLAGNWKASGGDLFLLVAASFFVLHRRCQMIERLGGVVTMTYATIIGSVPVLLFSLPAGLAVQWSQVPVSVFVAMLWAVTISAFMGWLVWGWVNSIRGVARTAPLMYLMPPVAGPVAWAWAGEHYTGTRAGGAAVTLGGVAIAQFSGSRRPAEAAASHRLSGPPSARHSWRKRRRPYCLPLRQFRGIDVHEFPRVVPDRVLLVAHHPRVAQVTARRATARSTGVELHDVFHLVDELQPRRAARHGVNLSVALIHVLELEARA